MVITRVKVGGKTYYSVNALRISEAALASMCEEIFTPEGWKTILEALSALGYVNCELRSRDVSPDDMRNALDAANQKIVSLEQKVAKLARKG